MHFVFTIAFSSGKNAFFYQKKFIEKCNRDFQLNSKEVSLITSQAFEKKSDKNN